MEFKVHAFGGGVAIPKTNISATFAMAALIGVRAAPKHPITSIVIGHDYSLGGNRGTLFASTVKTDWIRVDEGWAADIESLVGVVGSLTLEGTICGNGHIDLSFHKISKDGIETKLLDRKHVKAQGFQITETKVTGNVLLNKRDFVPRPEQKSAAYTSKTIEILV